jgi:hypothetical protein
MLDSLVRVSRRAGWAALCYRRRQEQALPEKQRADNANRAAADKSAQRHATGRSHEARARATRATRAYSIFNTVGQSAQTPGLRIATSSDTGSPPGFRPTPNGSRRATRGELRNPPGAQSATVSPPQEPASRKQKFTQRQRVASGRNTESPRSTFRAPPVYP